MALEPKLIRSRPPVTIGTRTMKRYDVTVTAEPIRPDVEAAALAMLPSLVPAGDGQTPEAGWIILHEGGDRTAMYLNAYCWVWDNVVEVHAAAAAQPHLGCADLDSTNFVTIEQRWIGCIWELPPFGHERSAWVRHVFGSDEADLAAYVADVLPDGPVGPPN
ncbi:MAG: hypothetical protein R2705_23690 [Ilumatobacteraceae bacterium]